MSNTDVPGVFKRKETIYKPSHYAKKPIETINFIEQTVADYPPEEAYLNRTITGEWKQ